ncbi:MAG TPA: hypothetical protein VFT22_35295 [Kofleriaceae bacterium]|nr:hypothetical protein [Kofleriaceae bacterium]
MSGPHGQLRRVALALGISTAMVVMIAWLLPRAYIVNDDPWLTQYLRRGAFTPWISPILVRALIAAYHHSPDVPWYGLYQYALIAVSGAVVIHTCLELVDPRPGPGRVATLLGASALGASEVLIATGVTWTVVSILSLGTSMAALVAHLHVCQATGRKASVHRALGYGLLATCGYMLRPAGLPAMVAALLPLFGWLALGLWRGRHLPRPAALIAAIAPLAIVIAIQNRIPQLPGAEFDKFNQARGQISGQNAFENLDTRAPELLERAGWTVDEYREFWNWTFYDDQHFTVPKLQRLIDTGGVPTPITADWAVSVLRIIVEESPAAVWLFLAGVIGAVLLAWLRVIEPGRGRVFALGYLACEIAVPLWMASQYRFPQRLSLPFYVVAAFGMFVILAREIAARPAEPELPPARAHHASFALLVITVVLFSWARNVIAWADRPASVYNYTPETRGFMDRTKARGGFVFPQVLVTDYDPLVVDPHGYAALLGGWGTFTGLWYDYLARFGLHHFREVLPWMVDNPDAYVIAALGSQTRFEEWSRRLLANSAVRLAMVDVADTFVWGRIGLFRMVTQPLARGTPEWQLLEHEAWEQERWLPGPPSVDDLAFRPVPFTAPYARHGSALHAPAAGITIEPIDGGVRCETAGSPVTACRVSGEEGQHAGIHAEVKGLRAARFELELLDAENIVSVHVLAESASHRTLRWRWDLDAQAHKFGFRGAFTVVPGYGAQRLQLVGGSLAPREIVALHIVITVKPGTRAGVEVRHLEVAEP